MSRTKKTSQVSETVYGETFDRGKIWIVRQRTKSRPIWWGHVHEKGRTIGVCSHHETKREALEWCLDRLGVL